MYCFRLTAFLFRTLVNTDKVLEKRAEQKWHWKPCLGLVDLFFLNPPQINMYLLSRILFALSRLAVEKGVIPQPKHDPFPLFATLVWGIVLWLFEYYPHTLQPSLQSSMNYLYHDSNVWHDISDFLVFNKPRTSA